MTTLPDWMTTERTPGEWALLQGSHNWTTPRGWDETATDPTDGNLTSTPCATCGRLTFAGRVCCTPPAHPPAVNAPAVDTSRLTGIAYAAVETTLFERIDDGVLMGIAVDGNGRQTLVDNVDRSLGMVHRHLQVLVAHAGSDVHDFTPGYIDHNDRLGKLVWVLS